MGTQSNNPGKREQPARLTGRNLDAWYARKSHPKPTAGQLRREQEKKAAEARRQAEVAKREERQQAARQRLSELDRQSPQSKPGGPARLSGPALDAWYQRTLEMERLKAIINAPLPTENRRSTYLVVCICWLLYMLVNTGAFFFDKTMDMYGAMTALASLVGFWLVASRGAIWFRAAMATLAIGAATLPQAVRWSNYDPRWIAIGFIVLIITAVLTFLTRSIVKWKYDKLLPPQQWSLWELVGLVTAFASLSMVLNLSFGEESIPEFLLSITLSDWAIIFLVPVNIVLLGHFLLIPKALRTWLPFWIAILAVLILMPVLDIFFMLGLEPIHHLEIALDAKFTSDVGVVFALHIIGTINFLSIALPYEAIRGFRPTYEYETALAQAERDTVAQQQSQEVKE